MKADEQVVIELNLWVHTPWCSSFVVSLHIWHMTLSCPLGVELINVCCEWGPAAAKPEMDLGGNIGALDVVDKSGCRARCHIPWFWWLFSSHTLPAWPPKLFKIKASANIQLTMSDCIIKTCIFFFKKMLVLAWGLEIS